MALTHKQGAASSRLRAIYLHLKDVIAERPSSDAKANLIQQRLNRCRQSAETSARLGCFYASSSSVFFPPWGLSCFFLLGAYAESVCVCAR